MRDTGLKTHLTSLTPSVEKVKLALLAIVANHLGKHFHRLILSHHGQKEKIS